MKKFASILTLTVLSLLFLLTNVNAEDTPTTTGATHTPTPTVTRTETKTVTETESPTPTNKLLQEAEQKTANQTERFDKAKSKADGYITERINALNKEIAAVKASQYASTSTSQAVITMLTNDIAGLTALKTQIDALTDPTTQLQTLLTDIKAIFVNFRIYEVELPKAHGLMHIQEVSGIVSNLNTASTNMANDIAYATSQGKTVTTIQADATAFNADVTKLSADITAATNALNALTPASYNNKGGVISQIKTLFANLHQDVQKARQDYKTFAKDYLALFKTTESTTPTASVTPTK